MTLALLGCMALAATPAPSQPPTAYTYRTPDGIVHYVGSEDDVPAAYRKAEKRIELTGVPATVTAPDESPGPSSKAPQILLAILLCLLAALLILWLRWPRGRIAVLALAIVDLGLGIYFGLQIWPGGSNPVRAAGPATSVRERVKTNRVVHRSQAQETPGGKTPSPSPAPASPASTAPPLEDPSAPGTPVRRVIKPAGAGAEPEDPEE